MMGSNEQEWAYLSGSGLPSEELMIEWAVRRVELGLQKDAAIGYRLQRGWPFVGETKANEELEKQSGLLFFSYDN